MVKLIDAVKTAKRKDFVKMKAKAIKQCITSEEIKRGKQRIIIHEINEIDGGVEVFAQVFKGKKQLGFGKDGTVDIERFRFFNPPVLVDDPNGDIVQVIEANETLRKPRRERRLREDTKEALIQSLEHTIKEFAKDGKNIKKGKLGKTITTVYSDAGTGSTTVDGGVTVNISNPGESWAAITGRASGTHAYTTISNGYTVYIIHASTANQFRYLGRDIFTFDTSTIGTDNISSAVLSIFHFNTAVDNSPAQTYSITSASPASNNNIVVGDYSQVGSTSFAEIAGSSVLPNAYNNFTLDANGIANINKTGVSGFSMRFKDDVDGTSPSWSSGAAAGFFSIYADTAGTANDPKLVIEHEAGVPANNSGLFLFF